MSIPKDVIRDEPGLSTWNIATMYRGSLAHGMYTPPAEPTSIDDKDVLAVCVPDDSYYYGLREYGSRGTKEIKRQEWDIVVYEARKYVSMLAQGNPNVLGSLWLRPEYYLNRTPAFNLLLENRAVFSGRHVYQPFTGYAHSQLHRMTHMVFEGYMGQKRKALVEQFGYDTKNAAHLIRLLRMGIEFLQHGEMFVFRHDAPQLLEIKRGQWTLEQVKVEADRLFKQAEVAWASSPLPDKPDREKVNELCVEVIKRSKQT